VTVDMEKLKSVAQIAGEDAEETELLRASLEEATAFLKAFDWCRGIREMYFGLGVGGVVSVFLFRIDAAPMVDEWVWVIVGDLPSCYLVTDEAQTPVGALKTYCDLMEDWVRAVRARRPLNDVFPVSAEPSEENADLLAKRIKLLRTDVIPAFA